MTLYDWLEAVTKNLDRFDIPSARIDAEIILAHTLRKPRTWLHAHGDELLDPRLQEIADARAELRLERVPVAYIIGHKEFYDRRFKVTPAVLIPRPESETIIDLLVRRAPTTGRLVDVGTGSGCLGITAKCELPGLDVTLIDNSRHALAVARENARALHAEVHCINSYLLDNTAGRFDIVIANLPYVDRTWPRSPETDTEPPEALFAAAHGLALISKLLEQLPYKLAPGGTAYIEADPEQHPAIVRQAASLALHHETTDGYIVVLKH